MSSRLIPGIGDRLRSYAIEELLGRGGMGVVYRATDIRLGRPVALKLLSDKLSRDESFRARFERESRLAAAIDHAHIVPVYEAGAAGGLLYIAMRYVDGSDLAAVLEREELLQPWRALDLVGQLASALDAAHERGLIHRDVKPSNALIARESGREHLYLADFGLTKSAGSHSVTATGQVMGTVLYMAPEVIRGEEPTAAADQYALGCVLYECLTGHVPFEGANEAAVIYGHLESPPPAPSQRVTGLPHELDAAVQRALAKHPNERWPSCSAFVDAARAGLEGSAEPVRRRRRPPVRVLALGAGAAGLAIAGVLGLRGGEGLELAALAGSSVAVVDPAGKLRAQVEVDGTAGRVAAAGNAIWVADDDRGTVSRLDPETHTVRQTIEVGHGPSALAADRNGVWVTNRQDGRLLQIASSTNEIVMRKKLGGGPSDVCLAGGLVWIAMPATRRVLRFDEGEPREPVRLEVQPERLACGEGAVWASSEAEGRVVQINPESGRPVRTVEVGIGAGALAAEGGGVWVANGLTGTVSR
ncbi:MAG: protein kinase domain-containing protein, partial [Solirubrobacteraceae bacterium]